MSTNIFDELDIEQKSTLFQLMKRYPFKLRKMFSSMQETFEEKMRIISPKFYKLYITGIKDVEC